jgi:hypothetical protein
MSLFLHKHNTLLMCSAYNNRSHVPLVTEALHPLTRPSCSRSTTPAHTSLLLQKHYTLSHVPPVTEALHPLTRPSCYRSTTPAHTSLLLQKHYTRSPVPPVTEALHQLTRPSCYRSTTHAHTSLMLQKHYTRSHIPLVTEALHPSDMRRSQQPLRCSELPVGHSRGHQSGRCGPGTTDRPVPRCSGWTRWDSTALGGGRGED